ncbi:MAG TPA: hypothetical protein VFV12_02900, partial [Xanthobacteraceae bacterium]|nr:hypothetical protein [Xanthobacteraceae bacterium]
MVRHRATSPCSDVEHLVIGIAATIHAKSPAGGTAGLFRLLFVARLDEQPCGCEHDPRDEYSHGGK